MLPTTKLGPFTLGIDNRSRDYALAHVAKSGETAVRDTVNTDLSNDGHLTRRCGRALVLSGSRVHSLWSNGNDSFFMEDGTLKRFRPPGTTFVVRAGLSPVARVAYCEVPGRGVVYSNSQVIESIGGAGAGPFSLVEPDVVTPGIERQGQYQAKFLLPLPAGDALVFHNGRTYSHLNGVVSYTEPWSGWFQPFANYFSFPVPVTIMAALPGGIYFVADKTYFLPGEATQEGNLRVVSETTGSRGTLLPIPGSDDVTWFTPQGLVRASTGGVLKFLQEDHVAVRGGGRGASLYRDQDGLKQIITAVRDPGSSNAGAQSWFTVKMGSRETRNEF